MIDNSFGGGIKKAPGLLKSNANHFNNDTPKRRATGGKALCHATWVSLVLKMIGIAKVQK